MGAVCICILGGSDRPGKKVDNRKNCDYVYMAYRDIVPLK